MLQLAFLIYLETTRLNTRPGQKRYYLWLLLITFLSFAADMMSSIQATSGVFLIMSTAGNYLEISLNTLLIPVFYRYLCDRIFNLNMKVKHAMDYILWTLTVFVVGLVLSTAVTGWIFYYDDAGTYHRGPLFPLLMITFFVMMVLVEGFLISQKLKIESHYFHSLVLFLAAPLVGWGLQFLIFGLPFSLLGITFATLVLFTNIQNRNIDRDYLTDVFNRKALDGYIRRKIGFSSQHKTFAAILLDIDDFKSINDHFGHSEGDAALIDTVRILREALTFSNFIARYGGDEFCIILDSDDPQAVEDTINRIGVCLSTFNDRKGKPYTLNFSMGYSIYELTDGNGFEEFLREIDQKMYKNKLAQKSSCIITE